MVKEEGRAELSMTADDVVVHTRTWHHMQAWLDACGMWACKKGIRWESAKCSVICKSTDEIEDTKTVLRIAGGVIKKTLSAVYLGVTLKSEGIDINLNEKSARKALGRTRVLASAGMLGTEGKRNRMDFILEKYLRST